MEQTVTNRESVLSENEQEIKVRVKEGKKEREEKKVKVMIRKQEERIRKEEEINNTIAEYEKILKEENLSIKTVKGVERNPFYDPNKVLDNSSRVIKKIGEDEKYVLVEKATKKEEKVYKGKEELKHKGRFIKVYMSPIQNIIALYLLPNNRLVAEIFMYMLAEKLSVNNDVVEIHPLDIERRFYKKNTMNLTYFHKAVFVLYRLGIIYPTTRPHMYFINVTKIVNGDIIKIALKQLQEDKINEQMKTLEARKRALRIN